MKLVRYDSYLSLLAIGINRLYSKEEQLTVQLEGLPSDEFLKEAGRLIHEIGIVKGQKTTLTSLLNNSVPNGPEVLLGANTIELIESTGLRL